MNKKNWKRIKLKDQTFFFNFSRLPIFFMYTNSLLSVFPYDKDNNFMIFLSSFQRKTNKQKILSSNKALGP